MNRPEKKRVIRMMVFPSVELGTAGIRNLAAVGLFSNLFQSFHWRNLGVIEVHFQIQKSLRILHPPGCKILHRYCSNFHRSKHAIPKFVLPQTILRKHPLTLLCSYNKSRLCELSAWLFLLWRDHFAVTVTDRPTTSTRLAVDSFVCPTTTSRARAR